MRAAPAPQVRAPMNATVARRAAVQPSTSSPTAGIIRRGGSTRTMSQGRAEAVFQSHYQDWQFPARRAARTSGVARFSANMVAATAARVTLRVEKRNAKGDWDESAPEDGLTDLLDDYRNDTLGQGAAELVRLHTWHYQVSGEACMVVRDDMAGQSEWLIVSMLAIEWDRPRMGEATVRLHPGGTVQDETAFVVPREQVIHFWMPDEEWLGLAVSPMTAAMGDLARYESLARYARRQSDNYLAMSGMLWTPPSAHTTDNDPDNPAADSDEGAPAPESPIYQQYKQWAKTALGDLDDTTLEAVIPPMVWWENEGGGDPAKFIEVGRGLDEHGMAHRSEALSDFARDVDVPAPLVTGGGTDIATNHWQAWLTRDRFLGSVAPTLDRVTHQDMTVSYLWPMLRLRGVKESDLVSYRIGYDATPVIKQPDESDKALKGWMAGLLSAPKALEKLGFDPDDLATEEDLKRLTLVLSGGATGGVAAPAPEGAPAPGDATGVGTPSGPPEGGPPGQSGDPFATAAASLRHEFLAEYAPHALRPGNGATPTNGNGHALTAAAEASLADDCRALSQHLAVTQHAAGIKPGPLMSLLSRAAAYADRGDQAKAAAALDDAIDVAAAVEDEARGKVLDGLADVVLGLAERAHGKAAAMTAGFDEDQHPRDDRGRFGEKADKGEKKKDGKGDGKGDRAKARKTVSEFIAQWHAPLPGQQGVKGMGGKAERRITKNLDDIFVSSARAAAAMNPEGKGAMVSLDVPPDVAEALALPDGEPADAMHLTLAHLSSDAASQDPTYQDSMRAAAEQTVGSDPAPMVVLTHVERFSPNEEGVEPVVLVSDAPELYALHQDLCAALDAGGVPYSDDHGFRAHVTLGYWPPEEGPAAGPLDEPVAFVPAGMSVHWADEVATVPFRMPQAASAARRAAGEWDEDRHPRDAHGKFQTITGAGTEDDPLRGFTSAEQALAAIAAGKHVEMQPEMLSVALDKLAQIANDAKAAGEKAPLYDLCKISVPDSNLFCADAVVENRIDMPQLSGIPTPGSPADALDRNAKGEVDLTSALKDALAKDGIAVTAESVPAAYLKASQNQLNGAKVAGMMTSIEAGTMEPGSIFVSSDNYVVDGHHRWAAEVGTDYAPDQKLGDISMDVQRIDMPIADVLAYANKFTADMGLPPQQAAVAALA